MALFGQGLKETGYIEGRNVAIKYRSADGRFDRLPALAAELVADPAASLLRPPRPLRWRPKAATATIPIVFTIGADPVDLGLVSSLNRPGGNVTGVNFLINSLGGKTAGIAARADAERHSDRLPHQSGQSSLRRRDQGRAGCGAHTRALIPVLNVSSERDIDAAFASFVRQRVNAVMVGADAFFTVRRDQLVELAARHAIPASYHIREFVAAGGLMSYGANLIDMYRLAGVYAGRILKGEKPAELPVQQTVKFELVDQPQDRQGARPRPCRRRCSPSPTR